MGRAAPRRPPRRDELPLARGPPRQALHRRPRSWLHLPARSAGLRLRPHTRGRGSDLARRRPDARRGRAEPALEVGQAPRRQEGGGVSPRTAAAAVAHRAAATVHVPTRTRTAPRRAPQRRRTGASRSRVAPGTRTIALPRYDFVGLLDRVLRGPLYIALIGILLAGIVFFNVDVLELNHGIARTDTRAVQLKRENAALTLQLAKLGSSERIQHVALARGLVLPQPGDVRYLRAHRQDAAHALRVMTSPDSTSALAAPPAASIVTQQSTPTPVSATPTTTTPTATTPATTVPPATSATPTAATTPPATTAQTTP